MACTHLTVTHCQLTPLGSDPSPSLLHADQAKNKKSNNPRLMRRCVSVCACVHVRLYACDWLRSWMEEDAVVVAPLLLTFLLYLRTACCRRSLIYSQGSYRRNRAATATCTHASLFLTFFYISSQVNRHEIISKHRFSSTHRLRRPPSASLWYDINVELNLCHSTNQIHQIHHLLTQL
jgi:hypothetical protein